MSRTLVIPNQLVLLKRVVGRVREAGLLRSSVYIARTSTRTLGRSNTFSIQSRNWFDCRAVPADIFTRFSKVVHGQLRPQAAPKIGNCRDSTRFLLSMSTESQRAAYCLTCHVPLLPVIRGGCGRELRDDYFRWHRYYSSSLCLGLGIGGPWNRQRGTHPRMQ